jgi:hypothetical protein
METLQRTANRGSISTGFDIDNSCKFEADNSEELNFTPSSSGSNQTWTFSCWFKQTELNATGTIFGHYTSSDNQALVRRLDTNEFSFRLVNGGTVRELKSDMLFRDTSAWYHLVVAVDTTDGTSTNRVKVYVNGEQISLTGTYPTSSLVTYGINTSSLLMDIGGTTTAGGTFRGFCGYLAEIHHIDGSQLAPTDFGETDEDSGIWKPKQVSGLTYGTNGFYLDFSDAANLGDDESGNGNDWTETNITAADQATDTPTNNFATLNPLHGTSYYTLKEGGTVLEPSQNGWGTGVSSIGVTSGKWYFEQRSTATDRTTIYGVVNESDVLDLQGDKHVGDGVYSVGFYGNNASVYSNGSVIATYNTFNQNQLVACALDLDNGKVYFAIQNTWQNSADPANGTGGISLPTGGSDTYFFGVNGYFSDNDVKTNHGGYTIQTPDSAASDANGHGVFEYAPPSGFYSICTQNLAEYG